MAKPKLEDLQTQANEIYSNYSANFAGKPRATRDLSLLDNLVDQLDSLIENTRTLMNGNRNPAILSFLETASENLERYREEKTAIQRAKENPHAVEQATLANRANRVFEKYQRHFAGKDRGTRDRMLLHEMIGQLEGLLDGLNELVAQGSTTAKSDVDTIETQLDMYRKELTNVARAQTNGTPEDVSNRLAQLANGQFTLYTDHFAGKSRVSRRPGLLKRMIANLEEYQAEMRELIENGFTGQQNKNNIDIVGQNLDMYRKELAEIQKVRAETSVADLAGALGGAANDVFGMYRDEFAGKDRRGRDLELMGTMCDRLGEVALQMRDIADEIELEVNEKNLTIVEERWATYENEYRMIKEAKGIA